MVLSLVLILVYILGERGEGTGVRPSGVILHDAKYDTSEDSGSGIAWRWGISYFSREETGPGRSRVYI